MLLVARTGGMEDPIYTGFANEDEAMARISYENHAKDLNSDIDGDRVDLMRIAQNGMIETIASTG